MVESGEDGRSDIHPFPRRTAALASQVRTGDLPARTGGDEFSARLDTADSEAAAQVADRMVHAVRDLNLIVTISVGIAAGPSVAIHDTINRADQAIYVAKGNGGDQTHTAPNEHRQRLRSQH